MLKIIRNTLLLFIAAPAMALVSAVPEGYTRCADDFGVCTTNNNWTGYYGANDTFVEISGTGAFTCLPQTFGIDDPVPNVQKACYIQNTNVLDGLMPCGVDGEQCDMSGTWRGVYGANSTYIDIEGSGSFVCLPQPLGVSDPVPNVQKTCYVTSTVASNNDCPNRKNEEGLLNFWLHNNDLEKFTELLQDGYNPDSISSGTGLPYSTMPSETVWGSTVSRAAFTCKPQFMQALINACANLNISHNGGPTPLDLAKRSNCSEVVSMLEAAGAQQAIPTPVPKRTYANLAMAAVDASEDTINEMIANGFANDVNRQSSQGHTALWVAVDYQNIGAVKALLAAGAKVDLYDTSGNHIFHKIANAKTYTGSFAYSRELATIAELIWQECPIRRPRDARSKTPLDLITANARTSSGRAMANQTLTIYQTLEKIHNGPAPNTSCP